MCAGKNNEMREMNQLSGGQKSLVAMALIFAIQVSSYTVYNQLSGGQKSLVAMVLIFAIQVSSYI